jgi:outer membrane immunogenic protein
MQLSFRNIVLVLLAAAALALAWVYTSTVRAEAGSFTGCYGGGALGYSAALSDTSLDHKTWGNIASVDSLAAQGGSVTALAGCDMQVGKSPLVLGVWGDHSWSEAEFSVDIGPATVLETGVDTSWAIGGRAGYVVVPGAMVYLKACYTQAELNDISFPATPLAKPLSVPTLDGYVFGGGAEVGLGSGLFLQVDYSYADYDQADIALSPTTSLGLDVDVQTARVGILFRLWGDEASNVAKEIEALAPPASKPLK